MRAISRFPSPAAPWGLVVLVLVGLGLPSEGVAQKPEKLDRLEFMVGCWAGQLDKDTQVEEIWTAAAGNTMLGLTRYLKKGETTSWEFTTIERTDSTVYFIPTSRGEQPDTFRVRFMNREAAAWARTGADFPGVIMYRRTADGSVIARLEPGEGAFDRSMELKFAPAKCPGH